MAVAENCSPGDILYLLPNSHGDKPGETPAILKGVLIGKTDGQIQGKQNLIIKVEVPGGTVVKSVSPNTAVGWGLSEKG